MPEELKASKTAFGTVVEVKYIPTEQYVEEDETTKLPKRSLKTLRTLGRVVHHDDSVIMLDLSNDEEFHDYRLFEVSQCVVTFYHESGGQAKGEKHA